MNISEKEFRELLDRYLSGTATPAERELLDAFFDSYDEPVLDDDVKSAADPRLRDEILQRIHVRTGEARRANRPITMWMAVAAALALFVVAYLFVIRPRKPVEPDQPISLNEQKTVAGQKGFLTLPDGTTVYLNSDSRIFYPAAFGETSRDVTMDGEAFFEVVRDGKPFVVQSRGMKTEVLGTRFNVKSRAGKNVEVTLVEGKVNVVSSSGESSLLRPNQQAVIAVNSAEVSTKDVNVLRFTSWKDNILFFEHTTLAQAIAEIESWYAVSIEIRNPALLKCVITAKYQDEPLGNVLSSFQFLLNLNIRKVDATHYTLDGQGCK